MKEMESQTKTSLKLQAYQYLKTKILNCEYRPNEFLNEQKLCAEMGNISRTPMRDALGRLEQEGLITILPKKGLMVSGITEEDVHSMFEMRLLVEPYALRTYGSGIPREQLETFAELMHHPDSITDLPSRPLALRTLSRIMYPASSSSRTVAQMLSTPSRHIRARPLVV